MNNKLFWGAKEISNYTGISKSKAYQFISIMRKEYDINPSHCLGGKIPKSIVIDFFNPEIKKRVD